MPSRNLVPRAVLLLLVPIVVALAAPVPDEPGEPTPEQLKKAKEDFARIKAVHTKTTDPRTKRSTHVFVLAQDTRDADMKPVPNPPFAFELHLFGSQVTAAGLKELKGLKNVTFLNLDNQQITDAALRNLREIGLLHALSGMQGDGKRPTAAGEVIALHLSFTQVTDEGLAELKDLKNLSTLVLAHTRVTDTGLKELKELKNLTTLELSGPRITDEGLAELKELKNLTTLSLSGTKVTEAGVEKLKEALPNCEIVVRR